MTNEEIEFMKLVKDNLVVGNTYKKGYPTLCTTFKQPNNGGDSKVAQLAEWKRYFRWDVKGHSFTILEIYDEVKESVFVHGGEREIIPYIKDIENFNINLLVQAKDNQITFPKSILYELLCMVNVNYKEYKFNTSTLSELTKIKKEQIDEFYKSSGDMLKRNLDKSLNNLKRKNMIFWKPILMVREVQTHDAQELYREATNNEYEFIMKAKSDTLKKMGLTDEWQVRKYDRWKEYQRILNELLVKEIEVEYAFEGYDIKLNREKLKEEWLKLDDEDKIIDRNAINSGILERALKLATGRMEEAVEYKNKSKRWGEIKDGKKRMRSGNSYVKDHKELSRLLLKMGTRRI